VKETLLPETYKFPARHHARPGDCSHAAGPKARAYGNLGAPPVLTSGQDARAAGYARLHRREEKTGKADERSRVAAVFVNRLRQKIKLQSDPTIIYGLVRRRERSAGRSTQ